ncbi:MAG: hypothetical protein ABW321_13965, partial [Polyangiales bacterium]
MTRACRTFQSHLVVGSGVIGLVLLGFGGGQLQPRAAAGKTPTCSVVQKKPLFVGFAEGTPLDGFESAVV